MLEGKATKKNVIRNIFSKRMSFAKYYKRRKY